MSESEAEEALRAAGFMVGVTTRQCSNTISEGMVISQEPPAGTLLTPGSTVSVVVSSGPCPPGYVVVPDVLNISLDAATAVLENAGLALGQVDQQCDNEHDLDTVISQEPAASVQVAPGSTVNLTVSTGDCPPDTISVPNVTGQTEAAARAAIMDLNLAVGNVTRQCSNTPAGIILSQTPIGGTQIIPGGVVNLVVSSGPCPPDKVTVPNVTGQTEATARTAITDATLTVGTVTRQCHPSVTVHSPMFLAR